MSNKEQAIRLANSLLQEYDTAVNKNTAAIRTLHSTDYDLLYEAIENGWVSERFFISGGIRMEDVSIERKD
ncbi:MAG TPA: hypothetical protein VF556_17575 [Pyrinomonadaceae bacterium]|jgi:hypothetical protein